jgi:hypothetical protein
METRDITFLLEKYFAGDTSLQEEKILRDFFAAGNVDAGLKHYAPLFQYLNIERACPQPVAYAFPKRRGRKRFLYAISSIAAGIALLAGGYFFSLPEEPRPLCEGTFVMINGKCFQDAETIAHYTAKALDALLETETNINENLDRSLQLINLPFQSLENLQIDIN